ncbi:hypothetical protein [Poseidonibacter ostreae]|uniref:Uncharacterized protein n=1 Tax=Poseidonibacter ostreae TaxID=2654171 RepID=A0A6L4WWL3_9BACT|nr:hypothetical protein [Poseidonibacter ostreae]KAB7891328.1 hypothetical protein GBG19_00395 [Poseidonibacter ostreae]
MIKKTERINLRISTTDYSSDTHFVKSKKNKDIVYVGKEKCKSLEYIFDSLVQDISIAVYDDLDKNKVWVTVTNSDIKTFEFNTDSIEYQNEKVESIINVILLKEGIKNVYFLEDSKYAKVIKIRNANIKIIDKTNFKNTVKKSPILKTAGKYTFASLLILLVLFGLHTAQEETAHIIKKDLVNDFNKQYSQKEKEIILQKDELQEYREIKDTTLEVLNSFENIKIKPKRNNFIGLPNRINNNFTKGIRFD